MIWIYIFSWMEIWILHRLHILDFQMLSLETRNQGKKNGNLVRTLIWIRPVQPYPICSVQTRQQENNR